MPHAGIFPFDVTGHRCHCIAAATGNGKAKERGITLPRSFRRNCSRWRKTVPVGLNGLRRQNRERLKGIHWPPGNRAFHEELMTDVAGTVVTSRGLSAPSMQQQQQLAQPALDLRRSTVPPPYCAAVSRAKMAWKCVQVAAMRQMQICHIRYPLQIAA